MSDHIGPQHGTIERDFRIFHRQNPHVYTKLRDLALELENKGHKRLGIGMLFEVLRWQTMMSTTDATGLKLNNNYRAYYARLIEYRTPALRGIFVMREQLYNQKFDPATVLD